MAFRMTNKAYLVLLALSERARHGYGIVQTVLDLSEGEVRLGAGTLYGLLDRMLTAGLIAEAGQEVVDGRLRRYYRMTEEGGAAAAAETARLTALANRAGRMLGGPALGGAS
ncbi:PadR family transcriptional regulator [Actinotalea sp. M2MS4P-6]|uniref:PadR family transcriptional regulator n=1 Tax=Actinotalea sp. M2MS4P-6 TaxID=2983762 RepID=UPI0021E50599|nr:PadR family transcriptional regulator [Actinotalea sp. M2MS4P-6]MCV2395307.1 PadR family transcriptional regulator [Actinotalea sp. M2MS4P-6]